MTTNVVDKVNFKYGYPTDCIAIDNAIGLITKEVAQLYLSASTDRPYINALESKRNSLLNVFNQQSCRNQIETLRLNETAFLSTKFAIEQERNILDKSKIEQRIYIAAGTIVVLIALYIILKK